MSDNDNDNEEEKNYQVLTHYELTLLIDALDELRKSNTIGLNEISKIGSLADKLGSWFSKARFGIDLANASESSNPIGISIGDTPSDVARQQRLEKDALGKK